MKTKRSLPIFAALTVAVLGFAAPSIEAAPPGKPQGKGNPSQTKGGPGNSQPSRPSQPSQPSHSSHSSHSHAAVQPVYRHRVVSPIVRRPGVILPSVQIGPVRIGVGPARVAPRVVYPAYRVAPRGCQFHR